MTRKQFMVEVAKYPGVEIDAESERHGNLILDSPKGKVFSASLTHSLSEPFENAGGQSWKPSAYADLAKRMSMGLTDCDDDNCDVCFD